MPHEPLTIESLDDPRIADYRDARDVELRGSRFTERHFLVESEPVLRRFLGSGFRAESMLLSPDRYDALQSVIEQHEPDCPIYLLDETTLREHAGYRHHHGVLAIGIRPDPSELSLDRWLERTCDRIGRPTLVLENITHVDNLGAFFRNAAAFDARGIVMDPNCADPLFRKSIRFSMGHVFKVPWAVAGDWTGDIERLRQVGMRLIALESGVNATPLREIPRQRPSAFVLGNEGHGLSAATLDLCDEVCEIPMVPSVPSVNVATAGAIALYEWNRAR